MEARKVLSKRQSMERMTGVEAVVLASFDCLEFCGLWNGSYTAAANHMGDRFLWVTGDQNVRYGKNVILRSQTI